MGRKIIIIIFQKSIDKMKWCGIMMLRKQIRNENGYD